MGAMPTGDESGTPSRLVRRSISRTSTSTFCAIARRSRWRRLRRKVASDSLPPSPKFHASRARRAWAARRNSGSVANGRGNTLVWVMAQYYTPVAIRSLGTLQRLATASVRAGIPAARRGHEMSGNGASARGVREVGYFDCPGGGQVVVDGGVAFVAHMQAPHGTTLVDVSDPSAPRRLATLAVPKGMHSHKVRVAGGLMLVNREAQPAGHPPPGFQGGLGIFDVSNPREPREIAFWRSGGAGVHRFTFDGRYAYISPELDGYVGNIVMILDLEDPRRPVEVGRWWMPGQWVAGGETPGWQGRAHRCHHPIRLGSRLYVSYWHGGFVI